MGEAPRVGVVLFRFHVTDELLCGGKGRQLRAADLILIINLMGFTITMETSFSACL